MSVDLNVECNAAIADLVKIKPQDWQEWFEAWLARAADSLNYEITLLFTNDTEIQQLNALYRQQDRPTDVLAFAALEADIPLPPADMQTEPEYLGDIVISVETAEKQASTQQHSLQWELAWLASHGLLHLLGWDHPDEASLEEMLAEQASLMQLTSLRQEDDFRVLLG